MVPDLGRERLVASDVEVGPASNFVGGDAFAGFDVAEDSDFRHWSFVVSEGCVCVCVCSEGRRG